MNLDSALLLIEKNAPDIEAILAKVGPSILVQIMPNIVNIAKTLTTATGTPAPAAK